MADGIERLGSRQIAAMVNSRQLTATAVVQSYLETIETHNGALNCLCAIDPDRSLKEAAALDAAGRVLPLAGVPVIVKDSLWVQGWRSTYGSRLYRDHVADRDCRAVARIRAAGAIVIGIGTCSEFACKGVTNSPLHGVTHNPISPDLTPGGSSGGNAAALAADFAPLSLATDSGGSARRPAAHCGVVGFKPTNDLVPYGPGFPEPVDGLSAISPMARTVDDIQLCIDVVAPDAAPSGAPSRVLFSPDFGIGAPMDEEVRETLDRAVDALRNAGLRIDSGVPDWPALLNDAELMGLQYAGLAQHFGQRWRSDPDLFDPVIGDQIEQGLRISAEAVSKALRASHLIRSGADRLFADVDIIIGATTPCTAWPHDRLGPAEIGGVAVGPRAHAALTPRFNHAGVPAISIPCGNAKGLPVGVQIVGRRGCDRTVLEFARQAEAIFNRTCLASGDI